MMLKLVALVCLAAVASATKSASYIVSQHNDAWCHSHHLGVGSETCVEHNGCCFSDSVTDQFISKSDKEQRAMEYGPCHSCDFHEDGWCAEFGSPKDKNSNTPWEDCVKLSGCTWDDENKICGSSKPDMVVEELVCEDFVADPEEKLERYLQCVDEKKVEEEEEAMEVEDPELREKKNLYIKSQKNGGCMELYYYKPECDPSDLTQYMPSQSDSIGQYFCVDVHGHEIPDTRKAQPLDTPGVNIDCAKERVKNLGYQCPNAMTLTTKGGVLSINEDNDALDCTQHCITDTDCNFKGEGEDDHWCCFNGCGYTCKQPVMPFAGCAAIPTNHAGQVVHQVDDKTNTVEMGTPMEHKMEISVSCEDGWDVLPLDKPQSVTLECKHGNWQKCDPDDRWDCTDEFELPCQKRCTPFEIANTARSVIDDLKMRERDFVIEGSDNHFSATRVISCTDGYGVVAGNEAAKRDQKETLTCSAGDLWLNDEGTERTIECSVCYDNMEWRDDNGNTCLYYQSRVMECLPEPYEQGNSAAQDNCRVACRTCLEAEAKFGKKERVNSLADIPVENRGKWKRIRSKVLKYKTRIETKSTRVQVPKSYPVTEVCAGDDIESYHAEKDENDVWVCNNGGELIQSA